MKPDMNINGLPIGDTFPCFIVAEIGQNHQGDVNIAKELIRLAKECGANCVKFQKSSLPDRFTKNALEAQYDSENSFGKTYGEHRSKLELSEKDFHELQMFSETNGIMFTASAMDIPSADFLMKMKVPFIKIGSGDTNNPLLIDHIAKTGYPIVLSTGMQEFATVRRSVKLIQKYHNKLAVLHCVSSYPTAPEDVNLAIIDQYRQEFKNLTIGYSGHEKGIFISVAAVARGAKIIERHFTKDNTMKGTDHKCSLNPGDFKLMVEAIREVEAAIGTPVKRMLSCETPCHEKLGKSIVSSKRLAANTVIRQEDIAIKVSHPHGIKPLDIDKVIGTMVKKEIADDSPICFHHIQ